MIWKLIAAPVIGAVIGYCTNWLAVKMLFRPREEKHIGKFRVPLTPGVIPRGKARLAKAMGEVVNTQLLTRETVEARLLSDDMKEMVRSTACDIAENMKNDKSVTVKQLTGRVISEEQTETALTELENMIVNRADKRIKEANLGVLVSDALVTKLDEAVSGTFIGKMMGDSLINMVGPAITQSVDGFVDQNSETMLRNIVSEEIQNLAQMPAEKIITGIENAGYDLPQMAVDLYEDAVRKKAGDVVAAIDVGDIAKNAVENMDNIQLESLVMSTMKTELRAVVNLGAVIGLLLGLINMVVYLI